MKKCAGCEESFDELYLCPVCAEAGCQACTDDCMTIHTENGEVETDG